jgi:hypothetical protein
MRVEGDDGGTRPAAGRRQAKLGQQVAMPAVEAVEHPHDREESAMTGLEPVNPGDDVH